jgi:hypothetical protein
MVSLAFFIVIRDKMPVQILRGCWTQFWRVDRALSPCLQKSIWRNFLSRLLWNGFGR